MSTQTILPADRDSVIELSRSRQEPEWMTGYRADGLELAGKLELPKLDKVRIDRWNLDFFGVYHPTREVADPHDLPEAAARLLETDALPNNLLVHYNSGVAYSRLSPDLAARGVIFCSMEQALKDHGELVRKYFMNTIKKEENLLTALHAGLWSGGAFLYIPRNVVVEEPVQALFYIDDSQARFAPHILIVAEANSSVTYVDTYGSGELTNHLVKNAVTEVFVHPGAKVNFASTLSLDKSITDLSYRRGHVENDGQINWVIGEMNYGDSMSDTTSMLMGNGSSSDAKVICVGSGEQKLSLTTRAVHFGKATDSDMITRAVMRDQSTAIINGITKIEKGSTGANGQQTEKVLMLSPRARGDANPILLIDEDDVKAGHAASVGQVNAEQLYYLMSRGISREQAMKLIIYGFLAPVVSEIPISRIQEQLQDLVERKLGHERRANS
jgi:Fe-S cluster assembly protein SufD